MRVWQLSTQSINNNKWFPPTTSSHSKTDQPAKCFSKREPVQTTLLKTLLLVLTEMTVAQSKISIFRMCRTRIWRKWRHLRIRVVCQSQPKHKVWPQQLKQWHHPPLSIIPRRSQLQTLITKRNNLLQAKLLNSHQRYLWYVGFINVYFWSRVRIKPKKPCKMVWQV